MNFCIKIINSTEENKNFITLADRVIHKHLLAQTSCVTYAGMLGFFLRYTQIYSFQKFIYISKHSIN